MLALAPRPSAQPPKQKEHRREQGARRVVSWWRWLFSQPRGGLRSGVSIALGWSAMVPKRAPDLILAMPRGLPALAGCTEQQDTYTEYMQSDYQSPQPGTACSSASSTYGALRLKVSERQFVIKGPSRRKRRKASNTICNSANTERQHHISHNGPEAHKSARIQLSPTAERVH